MKVSYQESAPEGKAREPCYWFSLQLLPLSLSFSEVVLEL